MRAASKRYASLTATEQTETTDAIKRLLKKRLPAKEWQLVDSVLNGDSDENLHKELGNKFLAKDSAVARELGLVLFLLRIRVLNELHDIAKATSEIDQDFQYSGVAKSGRGESVKKSAAQGGRSW